MQREEEDRCGHKSEERVSWGTRANEGRDGCLICVYPFRILYSSILVARQLSTFRNGCTHERRNPD